MPNHTIRPVIPELRESAAPDLTGDPAVYAAARGLLSASCLSGAQLEALRAHLAAERQPIADRAPWSDLPHMTDEPPYPGVGMVEPSSSPFWTRLIPSTATVFWMAVSAWLGFLLARAEGWL